MRWARARAAALLASMWMPAATLLTPVDASAPALGDVVMDHASTRNGIPAVVFPHWKHRTEFRCYACHPDPFEMRAGSTKITMSDLSQGRFCGRCHDGKTAFAPSFDTCRECHSHEAP